MSKKTHQTDLYNNAKKRSEKKNLLKNVVEAKHDINKKSASVSCVYSNEIITLGDQDEKAAEVSSQMKEIVAEWKNEVRDFITNSGDVRDETEK